MTLRGRLTTAFLAVVLGPVLLGAFFVGGAVTAVGADRAMERLDRATTAVATSVGALCRQLNVAAGAVAIVTDAVGRQAAADRVVAGGFGSAVQVMAADGVPVLTTADAPPQPWLDCAGPPGLGAESAGGTEFGAIAARVEVRDAAGASLGSVTVASALDHGFVARLADAAGCSVTLLGSSPNGGPVAVHSTEPSGARDAVVRAAAGVTGGRTTRSDDGTRYVRRIGPSEKEPLPLALSVPRRAPQGLYALLVAAVVLTGVFVVAMAWWLARSTTRPLAELARAADRVAGGDLDARVPVRAQDEVGRLAATFNRMTRETQGYVQALTASRDQLRGHLAILGDTLSSTHDLGRILQVILQTALAATGARAGVVLLLDPATSTLVGQCAEGLDGRWPTEEPSEREPAALRVPVGTGLLGSVAATGVPLRGHIDRDGPVLSAREPRCRTYVAVPFAVPGPLGRDGLGRDGLGRDGLGGDGLGAGGLGGAPLGGGGGLGGDLGTSGDPSRPAALGVLALYDRLGSDEFDDSDVTTLRTFAGQAAVAVDNVRVHREAQRLSLTDPLTSLWNYRYLQESVRREVERASRFQRLLAVLAMDLDRFKEVNDTYGHGAGDAVLAEFARRVRTGLREVDLAFRQGGEEFVVLLPETDEVGAVAVADRLGAIIRDEPVSIHPHEYVGPPEEPVRIAVTVSIGIAIYPEHAVTAEQVLDAADDALYAAKAAGRDTYRVAEASRNLRIQELQVRVTTVTPDDGLPRAGCPAPGAPSAAPGAVATEVPDGDSAGGGACPSGASGATHPPRQSRGR